MCACITAELSEHGPCAVRCGGGGGRERPVTYPGLLSLPCPARAMFDTTCHQSSPLRATQGHIPVPSHVLGGGFESLAGERV